MFIYKITNIINGKAYIGKSVRPVSNRWCRHKRAARDGSTLPFHLAIAKYGNENFEVVTLSGHKDKEELKEAERAAIKEHRTMVPDGYNRTPGGDGGPSGMKRSPEFCERMREIGKKYGFTKEAREKGRAASRGATWNRGRVRSAEQRKKISETKRNQHRPAWNKGLKMPNLIGNQHARGYRHTEAAKRRIGQAAIGNRYAGARLLTVQAN